MDAAQQARLWSERYEAAGKRYLFGTEPSQFLRSRQSFLPPPGARIWSVADGEGRNSVWLAQQGYEVTATDIATAGLDKARKLAADRHVAVQFMEADAVAGPPDIEAFDAVVAVFVQFVGPEDRPALFDSLQRAIRPGGLLLLHGYTPAQLGYGTGGPSAVENLYTEPMLRDAFCALELLHLESYERHLDEGEGHRGTSALLDLVARRPVR